MSKIEDLRQKRDKIRSKMVAGKAPHTVGLAIDYVELKLISFNDNEEATRKLFLGEFGERGLEDVVLNFAQVNRYSGAPGAEHSPSKLSIVKLREGDVDLLPASPIKPDGGSGGRVGCFVKLSNPKDLIAVITVRHIFEKPGSEKSVRLDMSDIDVGIPLCFGALTTAGGAVNYADCALFSLTGNVTPKDGGMLSGEYIKPEKIPDVTKAIVKRIDVENSGTTGQVLDTEAVVVYDVFLGKRDDDGNQISEPVLFDRQVFVGGTNFGDRGSSGSPVVMNEADANGVFKPGDLLGLYSAIIDTDDYHFLAPFHECINTFAGKLEEVKIFMP